MCITEMTKKEFEALPSRKWGEDIGTFNSLVMLPTKRMHDSGFRCIDFVAVRKNEPICRLSGGSDVLHIDGIGGYGNGWRKGRTIGLPETIPAKGWSIDCLKKSGLFRLFADGELSAGDALSSFEIYAVKRRR